jgi:ribosomal protein L7/L12
MEWWIGLLLALGVFSVFTIERRLDAILRQLVIMQRKADAALKHLGIDQLPPTGGKLSARVQEIASDPIRKIEAIKAYREESGASLRDAKDAVEKWMDENRT